MTDVTDSDYGLDQLFPQILGRSPYITTDPAQADYFYVDAWMFWPHASNDIREVVEEIKKKGPWWARKGGRDFIFVITADIARCNGYHHKEVENAIFVHYFGGKIHGTEFFGGSPADRNGAELDRLMIMSDRISFKEISSSSPTIASPRPYGLDFQTCHRPQDIVVPLTLFERTPQVDCHHSHYKGTPNSKLDAVYDRQNTPHTGRTINLLFAGLVYMERPEYSLGARQTVLALFKHREAELNFSLNSGHDGNYFANIKRSIFCLAAGGFGWGSRFKVALVRGCIPMQIQDGVRAEFEENLPIHEYSVRVPLQYAYTIPQIIKTMQENGKITEMQKKLECAWRLHWWRAPDGKAFDVVACILRRRIKGLDDKIHRVDFDGCTMTCIDGEEPMPLKIR